jgi:hypothetical protein
MNPNIKAQWVEALRSGEYNQRRDGSETVTIFGSGYNAFLPSEVVEWAELGGDNPEVSVPGKTYSKSVIDLNDNGTPFSEIADIIEREF